MILVWHQSKQPININWFLYMASVIFLQEEFLREKEEVNRTMTTCPRLQSAKRSTSQILLILEDKKSLFHLVSVVRLKGIHFSYKTFTWQIQIRNKFWSRKLTVASTFSSVSVASTLGPSGTRLFRRRRCELTFAEMRHFRQSRTEADINKSLQI